jgi:hypothetical protein
LGVSKKISELTVRSEQTVPPYSIKISTVYKQTETSFYLSLVTSEYHPTRLKGFLRPWYIWRKPCTYLALKLTLSPNGPKELTFEPSHPGVPSSASKTIS